MPNYNFLVQIRSRFMVGYNLKIKFNILGKVSFFRLNFTPCRAKLNVNVLMM